MKAQYYLGIILALCTIPIFYLSCLSDDLKPSYTIVPNDGESLIQALCDSSGCKITTSDYTFTDVVLVQIMFKDENGYWVLGDTIPPGVDPYFSMAEFIGVPDSLVCSAFVIQGTLTSFSGYMEWIGPYDSGDHAFRIDEADHPLWQLGFFKHCD